MEKIIEVSGLKKSYGPVEAVKGISFYVERGSFFAFLGPNGAGKSTTINIINTLLAADEGQVIIGGHVLGKEDDQIRALMSTVFQESVLDDLLTVRENLLTRGSFYYSDKESLRKAVDKAAHSAGTSDYLSRRYGRLSGGQKRRSDIARALVNIPRILILDEPTTGLDPQTRQNIWQVLEDLRKEQDLTIFLTTHYMEEAAKADYVVIIDEGIIAAEGTPFQLKEAYSQDQLILHTDEPAQVRDLLAAWGLASEVKNDRITLLLEDTLQALPILAELSDRIKGFQVIEGDMNDAFLNITGRGLRE
ncbi:MAG TPA: ABC transporter ATP-binding protein [Clostridia bacterium]|nr:ABC transporter ATP-binding protein [Clostridia bacterium]